MNLGKFAPEKFDRPWCDPDSFTGIIEGERERASRNEDFVGQSVIIT